MKVHEQVSFLEREAVHVVVGTPARVLKLCELSKLKLSELKVSEEEVFPSFLGENFLCETLCACWCCLCLLFVFHFI